jgi:distribution and morphology protein 34
LASVDQLGRFFFVAVIMSFNFNWAFFDKGSLTYKAREVLKDTMNKGVKPEVLVDDIQVDTLDFGNIPPELEILEIGDLGEDKFRGIFKLEYSGDASLSLRTKVEANPLALLCKQAPRNAFPSILAASRSLELPLSILLSEIKLSAIVILVFSKARGLTLVFQNDPLESVTVISTFDFLPGIANFIKQEIEERLRESFREDIPEVLYQLSQEKASSDRETDMKYLLSQIQHAPHSPTNQPLLSDLFPEHTYEGSESTICGLQELDISQATLSISTPGISDCVSRSTLVAYEQTSQARPETNEEKLSKLVHFQSLPSPKLYRDVRPRRRVIKLQNGSRPFSSMPVTTNHTPSVETVATKSPAYAAPTPIRLNLDALFEKQREVLKRRENPCKWSPPMVAVHEPPPQYGVWHEI